MAKTIKGSIVEEYLGRFPNTASLTLARKIYKENKTVFTDVEDVRTKLRYRRGSMGDNARKKVADKTYVRPVGTFKHNPFQLPESHAEAREPYVLPKANNNILVISDLHIPYHDIGAITAAMKYGVEAKVNTILINGDLIDFHQMSRFEKDPRARSTKEEFDTTRAILEKLRQAFPTQKIVWLKGNHDKRYEKWLFAKAPEIFDDSYYQLDARLGLNDLKIELLDDITLIKAGKLFITHGHLMIKGVFAPVNAARGLFLRAKASTLIGHTHSVSEHTEKNIGQEITTCWSTGCLCELQPAYDPYTNKHAHGFAHVRVDKEGGYSVKNYRIYNGKIL